jgi:hypothetical protein
MSRELRVRGIRIQQHRGVHTMTTDQVKPKPVQGGQQQSAGGQNREQQPQQLSQHGGAGPHMAKDQVSFYDESLKKQIEGSFKTDGKSIHVFSAYGNKSFPYNDLGAIIDYNAQVLLVQKVLGELARDPNSGSFKEAQKQRDDHNQLQPGGSNSCWGGGSGVGANP